MLNRQKPFNMTNKQGHNREKVFWKKERWRKNRIFISAWNYLAYYLSLKMRVILHLTNIESLVLKNILFKVQFKAVLKKSLNFRFNLFLTGQVVLNLVESFQMSSLCFNKPLLSILRIFLNKNNGKCDY